MEQINGIWYEDEDAARWWQMQQAVMDGERAEAEAYEAQLEMVRPLDPTEVLAALVQQTDVADSLPDEVVGRMQPYFPRWDATATYAVGDRVTYGDGDGDVYRCLQDHAAQEAWTPSDAPSLWAKVLTSTTDVLPWVQPDSTNPYMAGDRVIWDGKVWESTIDNNVWMPGAVGCEGLWTEVA